MRKHSTARSFVGTAEILQTSRPAGGASAAARAPAGARQNLANPKMAAFFPALLPQFAPHADGGFVVLLALGFTFATMTLVWLTAYAFAVARVGRVLRRPSVRRALEAVTGAVLIGLGLRLAVERR